MAYFTASDLSNATTLGGFPGPRRYKHSKGMGYKIIGYEIIRDEMEWDFNSIVPMVTNERGRLEYRLDNSSDGESSHIFKSSVIGRKRSG